VRKDVKGGNREILTYFKIFTTQQLAENIDGNQGKSLINLANYLVVIGIMYSTNRTRLFSV
jgi:hypothetical protein